MLPKALDAVGVQLRVGAEHLEGSPDGLGDEHSIERIAMMEGKPGDELAVLRLDPEPEIPLMRSSSPTTSRIGRGPETLPMLCLIAISPRLAALRNSVFSGSRKHCAAVLLSLELSLMAQRNACVSSRRFTPCTPRSRREAHRNHPRSASCPPHRRGDAEGALQAAARLDQRPVPFAMMISSPLRASRIRRGVPFSPCG